MTDLERAGALMTAVQKDEGYSCEEFISDGYGYFDDMTAAIAKEFARLREETIEECAKAVATEGIVLEGKWGKSVITRVKVGNINIRRELAKSLRALKKGKL